MASSEEPPYDITGKGEPTIGSNPKTIDILIVTYKKIAKAKPKQNNLEKNFLKSNQF